MISGLKNVVVTPLSHESCSVLKAADALNNRRGYVAKQSNDALAYVYLEDMEQMGEGELKLVRRLRRAVLPRDSESGFNNRRPTERGW